MILVVDDVGSVYKFYDKAKAFNLANTLKGSQVIDTESYIDEILNEENKKNQRFMMIKLTRMIEKATVYDVTDVKLSNIWAKIFE